MKIEKGIPIPTARGNGPFGGFTDTLRKMKRGESVFFDKSNVSYARNAHAIARQAGVKVATRTVDGGLRVWRIE